MLIPAGPSAMLLASVAELVGIDEGPIAGYLTISVRHIFFLVAVIYSHCVAFHLVFILPSDGCDMFPRPYSRREGVQEITFLKGRVAPCGLVFLSSRGLFFPSDY